MHSHTALNTAGFTLFALIAFAANSVLCRMALGEQSIDAGSFTLIRLLSGIIILLLIWYPGRNDSGSKASAERPTPRGSWRAGALLFLYAITFSYAYIRLETGTGALILFGMVQITMVVTGLLQGQRLCWLEWLGLVLACVGFIYLLAPSINTPELAGFVLMAIAGLAWAGYTLLGRGSVSPLSDTCFNFVRTLPLVLMALIWVIADAHLTGQGIFLAIASGALASGLGYAVWYRALRGLSGIQAGVLQLLVPVIAAIGGVLFASEPITQRLLLAGLLVLGGVLLVLLGRYNDGRA